MNNQLVKGQINAEWLHCSVWFVQTVSGHGNPWKCECIYAVKSQVNDTHTHIQHNNNMIKFMQNALQAQNLALALPTFKPKILTK